MSEIVCPCCGADSPEAALYCMHCGEPIQCKSCGAPVLAEASACIQCGALIRERAAGERRFAAGGVVPPGYNRLTVHQKADSYQYDADFLFSDNIGQQTGEFIGHLAGFGDKASFSRPLPQQQADASRVAEIENSQLELLQPPAALGAAVTSPGGDPTEKSNASPIERAMREVFVERDGKLMLQVMDLKASSQTDYTLRLAHMYMYTRQTWLNEQNTPRAEIYEVAEFAGVPRDNVNVYLSRDNYISRNSSGDMLALKISGIDHAKKSLLEVQDSEVVGKWLPSGEPRNAARPRKAAKRGGDENAEDSRIEAAVTHTETEALVRDIPHDVISSMTLMDKVIVALYGLHKAGLQGEVFYNTIEAYLYEGFDLEVSSESIGSSLRRATSQNSKYVVHKDGAGYRITGSGIKYVEDVLRAKKAGTVLIEQSELPEA